MHTKNVTTKQKKDISPNAKLFFPGFLKRKIDEREYRYQY